MVGLLDSASAVIATSARRIEVAAQNIANISTPGYKRQVAFASMLNPTAKTVANQNELQLLGGLRIDTASDLRPGAFVQTSNPFDIAISGDGFFAVRTLDGIGYTRQGQFTRDGAGQLSTAQGWVLQAQGGGDVVLRGSNVRFESDGTIIEDDRPTTRIGVVNFERPVDLIRRDGGLFASTGQSPFDVERANLKTGTVEASNVNSGDDMVKMMEALRTAETGQRLALAYDDLMNRAVSTFGQAA